VVPQQPPTIFSQPSSAHSRICGPAIPASPEAGWQERIGQSGIRIRRNVTRRDPADLLDERPHQIGARAQFKPTLSGWACATEFQNASTVWPVSVRPARSVIVPEIMMGIRFPPSSSKNLRDCKECRFGIQGIEDRFDEQHVDTALDQRSNLLRIREDQLLEADRAKARVVHIARDGGSHRHRPDGTGDHAASARSLHRCTRHFGGSDIHFPGEVLQVTCR
jgi:hypothetical protein